MTTELIKMIQDDLPRLRNNVQWAKERLRAAKEDGYEEIAKTAAKLVKVEEDILKKATEELNELLAKKH